MKDHQPRTIRPIVLLALAALLAAPAIAQEEMPAIEVEPRTFDWVDVDEEAEVATYTWDAVLANGDPEEHEVNVVLQLLDSADAVQHEETVRVTIGAEGTETVQGGEEVELALARRVVALRHVVTLPE